MDTGMEANCTKEQTLQKAILEGLDSLLGQKSPHWRQDSAGADPVASVSRRGLHPHWRSNPSLPASTNAASADGAPERPPCRAAGRPGTRNPSANGASTTSPRHAWR